VPGRRRRFRSVSTSRLIRSTTTDGSPTRAASKGGTANAPFRLGRCRRTPGACTRCTATSGSGAPTGTGNTQRGPSLTPEVRRRRLPRAARRLVAPRRRERAFRRPVQGRAWPAPRLHRVPARHRSSRAGGAGLSRESGRMAVRDGRLSARRGSRYKALRYEASQTRPLRWPSVSSSCCQTALSCGGVRRSLATIRRSGGRSQRSPPDKERSIGDIGRSAADRDTSIVAMERRIISVHRSIFRIDRRIRARERSVAATDRRISLVHRSLVDTDRFILAMNRSIARMKRCITLVHAPVSHHHPPSDQKLVRGPRHGSRKGFGAGDRQGTPRTSPRRHCDPGGGARGFSSALQRA
jgi:hypothetical protein